jgi:hypothetical protein
MSVASATNGRNPPTSRRLMPHVDSKSHVLHPLSTLDHDWDLCNAFPNNHHFHITRGEVRFLSTHGAGLHLTTERYPRSRSTTRPPHLSSQLLPYRVAIIVSGASL